MLAPRYKVDGLVGVAGEAIVGAHYRILEIVDIKDL